MDEYIKRKAALEECDWYANEFCECEYAIMPLKGALEILPTADVRPVVFCKDCRAYDAETGWCELVGYERSSICFCSEGEKREES